MGRQPGIKGTRLEWEGLSRFTSAVLGSQPALAFRPAERTPCFIPNVPLATSLPLPLPTPEWPSNVRTGGFVRDSAPGGFATTPGLAETMDSRSRFTQPNTSFTLHHLERLQVLIAQMNLDQLTPEHVAGQLLAELGCCLNKLWVHL